MRRMIVFKRPDGVRFAIAAPDIRQVFQRADLVSCDIFFLDSKKTLHTEVVSGTFDNIITRIEENTE